MPPATLESCAHTFHPFGGCHFVVAGLALALMGLVVALGVRWRRAKPSLEARLRTGWCVAGFGVVAWGLTWYLLPSHFDPGISLPLHLCDLAAIAAPFTMLSKSRWLRSVLYFWGLGLSTQAFVTPIIQSGYAHTPFWLFWLGHTLIVGSAVYDIVVRGYRPTWGDFARTAIVNAAYIAVVLPLTLALDANYGFIGRSTPDARTLIDALGPWPWRILLLVAIIHAVMAVMVIAWKLGGLVAGATPTGTHSGDPPDAGPGNP